MRVLFLCAALVLVACGKGEVQPDVSRTFSFKIENVTVEGVVADPKDLAAEKAKAEVAVKLAR